MPYFRKDNECGRKIDVSQGILQLIIGSMSVICLIPVLLVIIVAFSSEASIVEKGFSYFPSEWSLDGFRHVFRMKDQLLRAYGVTIYEAFVGSLLTILITSMFAYVLSQDNFIPNKFLAKFVVFTTLFSGGLFGNYLVNTNLYGLKNNLLVLVLPSCVTAWNVIVMRTFIRSNVPKSIIESAAIDGAGEIYTFFRIVMPIMKPVMASIGFRSAVSHWNEWQTAYLYLDNAKKATLQLVLVRIEDEIDYLRRNLETLSAEEILELQNSPAETARMAILFFSIAPIMFSYPFFQKYFIKGITMGSVKG